MIHWEFILLTESTNLPEEVLIGIQDTFADGFGLKTGWSLKEIHEALSRSTVLGLVYDERNRVNGYAFYSIPDEPFMDRYLLWEDAICLRKVIHGSKLSSRSLFEKVSHLYPQRVFGWLGGRTQNPLVMLRYSRMGTVFPFENSYAEGFGGIVFEFLQKHIVEVKDCISTLDRRTGICKGVYPEGRLGDYQIPLEGAEKFEQILSAWGFDREKGDAVIVISKLFSPISG